MNKPEKADMISSHGLVEVPMADAIRVLAMDAVQKANSGHPGMPMGMADVAAVLFNRFINIDPADPAWPDRDRFVLSAGHGSMLQYAVHHLLGYADVPATELQRFRQLGSHTPGHPEYGHTLGVETTTGPLGQGLATAVGMALAERMLAARFGAGLVDHFTYVIAGDGCLMEGISHEAIDLAGHLALNRLIVFWDDNSITIDGKTSMSTSTNQRERFSAAGWNVERVDGHDHEAIAAAIVSARAALRPTLIDCQTVIGRGAPNLAGSEKTHGAPLGDAEVAAARRNLGWTALPFETPEAIVASWRGVAARGAARNRQWQARLSASPQAAKFRSAIAAEIPAAVFEGLAAFRAEHAVKATKVATRKASEMALAVINAKTDLTIGGSADLTHSNLTLTAGMGTITATSHAGRYIHYGVREHAMAAAMNGLALHGGFVPYGGTFLAFADYARGAIRLSALMKQRVIYVLTHDSIGLGEDGPTHQPVEHLAMLRATPNLDVYRPADIVETAECWELALQSRDRPSVLVLSRQNLPALPRHGAGENRSAHGAYVVEDVDAERHLTILATGSEVEVALAAAALLKAKGVAVAVVSMPFWEHFERQPVAYRRRVLGTAPRVGVEAAARLGWDRWVGESGTFVGMTGFGASAPAGDLYRHFGITGEAVAAAGAALVDQAGRQQ